MGYLLLLSYVVVFVIWCSIVTKWFEDLGAGIMISFLGVLLAGAFGTGGIQDSSCDSWQGDLLSECLQAIPFEYYFIPVGVLLGLALITALFVYKKAISRFFTGTALAMGNFFRRHQERFLKYREEKRVVSNAETVFLKEGVPPNTLEAIRKALNDRIECLEKIPKLEKLLVALRRHRSDVEENIAKSEEWVKKSLSLHMTTDEYFAAIAKDEKDDLSATSASIGDTERKIAEYKKLLGEVLEFLKVVPQQKNYYREADKLAKKILKEQQGLKKTLVS